MSTSCYWSYRSALWVILKNIHVMTLCTYEWQGQWNSPQNSRISTSGGAIISLTKINIASKLNIWVSDLNSRNMWFRNVRSEFGILFHIFLTYLYVNTGESTTFGIVSIINYIATYLLCDCPISETFVLRCLFLRLTCRRYNFGWYFLWFTPFWCITTLAV